MGSLNTFKRGQSSKAALDIGLTTERKIELLLDIKKRTEAPFWVLGKNNEPEVDKNSVTWKNTSVIIRKITTGFYDWKEGLPSRVLELWSEDTIIPEKDLKWLEWDFCLESLKPIALEAIQNHSCSGKSHKILYRHQYIIKKNLEELVIEVMG